jgi:hypothetical protein
MKHLYCAQCGLELLHTRVVIRNQGRIIDVVEPHNCPETTTDIPTDDKPTPSEIVPKDRAQPPNVSAMFKAFKFVKNIDNLSPKDPRHTEMDDLDEVNYGDRRPEKHKKPITSTAPRSILDEVKKMKTTSVNSSTIDDVEEGDA